MCMGGIDNGTKPYPEQAVALEDVALEDVALEDLSHQTLVDHATQLQNDYNQISGEYENQLEEMEDDLDEARSMLFEKEQEFLGFKEEIDKEIADKNNQLASLQVNLDRAGEDLKTIKKMLENQVQLKNKHIDLHIASSARANEAEQELKMVRKTVEEVSGHLRESAEEAERLDTENQKLSISLNDSKAAESRLSRKIRKLEEQLENHPATINHKVSMAELRYKTVQTMIRWGALFASVFSIGYHLA